MARLGVAWTGKAVEAGTGKAVEAWTAKA